MPGTAPTLNLATGPGIDRADTSILKRLIWVRHESLWWPAVLYRSYLELQQHLYPQINSYAIKAQLTLSIMRQMQEKRHVEIARLLGRAKLDFFEVQEGDYLEFYWHVPELLPEVCDIRKYKGRLDLFVDIHQALDEVEAIFREVADKKVFFLKSGQECWLERAKSKVESLPEGAKLESRNVNADDECSVNSLQRFRESLGQVDQHVGVNPLPTHRSVEKDPFNCLRSPPNPDQKKTKNGNEPEKGRYPTQQFAIEHNSANSPRWKHSSSNIQKVKSHPYFGAEWTTTSNDSSISSGHSTPQRLLHEGTSPRKSTKSCYENQNIRGKSGLILPSRVFQAASSAARQSHAPRAMSPRCNDQETKCEEAPNVGVNWDDTEQGILSANDLNSLSVTSSLSSNFSNRSRQEAAIEGPHPSTESALIANPSLPTNLSMVPSRASTEVANNLTTGEKTSAARKPERSTRQRGKGRVKLPMMKGAPTKPPGPFDMFSNAPPWARDDCIAPRSGYYSGSSESRELPLRPHGYRYRESNQSSSAGRNRRKTKPVSRSLIQNSNVDLPQLAKSAPLKEPKNDVTFCGVASS